MSKYVAILPVPAGATHWPTEDVPVLTASVLCGVPDDAPDPLVSADELRRLNAEHERGAGKSLDEDERALFMSVCSDAGPTQIAKPPTYREWGRYLEAFNSTAVERGWWAALMPIPDAQDVWRTSRQVTITQHRTLLVSAIKNGTVTARFSDMVPAPSWTSLSHTVLTLGELEKFCALLCVGVEVRDGSALLAMEERQRRASPNDDAWRELAQVEAQKIIKRQADRDLYPSQESIADEIAADFRKRVPRIVGADGKPLSGPTMDTECGQILVQQRDQVPGRFARFIVSGPDIHVPLATWWLHE